MEKLVLWQLKDTSLKDKPYHNNQHTFRKARGTDDALHSGKFIKQLGPFVLPHFERAFLALYNGFLLILDQFLNDFEIFDFFLDFIIFSPKCQYLLLKLPQLQKNNQFFDQGLWQTPAKSFLTNLVKTSKNKIALMPWANGGKQYKKKKVKNALFYYIKLKIMTT